MARDAADSEIDMGKSGLTTTARHMADAVAYLMRAARQADMRKVAIELGRVRADLIALSGEQINKSNSD